MRNEVSAGAVIYSPRRKKFLLLKHRDGHWEFAKGGVEPGETLDQARLREVQEETGLSDCTVLPFSAHTEYQFYRRGRINKEVEYGLLLCDAKVRISEEHQEYRWVRFDHAMRMLRFPDHRSVLRQAATALVATGKLVPGFSPD